MTFAQRSMLCLLVLGLAAPVALAGPNAGGTLLLHDAGLAYTVDTTVYLSTPPASCPGGVDNQLPAGEPPAGSAGHVWKMYAAFPEGSSPRLKAFAVGDSVDASVVVVAWGLIDPSVDFEIPQDGWPTVNHGGVGVSLGQTKTDPINEVYWFGGYGYEGGHFALVDHPVQEMIFVDDEVPPNEDNIVGLGSIGFGVPGETVCPFIPTPTGACCLPDGTCLPNLEVTACTGQGGVYQGDDVPCTPTLCPVPTGACCLTNGICEIRSEGQCDFVDGIYQGSGSQCTPNPCPLAWACCTGGACTILTQDACIADGGTWAETYTCDQVNPIDCTPTPTEPSTWGRIKTRYGH